jgi:C4-dicarboxylate-specific signal transduction histidine kinase
VNLLMNAMDAMTHVPAGRRRLTVDTEDRGIEVDVAVRDTGTGLPAEIEQQLFAPFVTNKSQGMGIGLAIVRTIIDAHGGTIHARNNPDFGATFTVTLRRSEAPEMAGAR